MQYTNEMERVLKEKCFRLWIFKFSNVFRVKVLLESDQGNGLSQVASVEFQMSPEMKMYSRPDDQMMRLFLGRFDIFRRTSVVYS